MEKENYSSVDKTTATITVDKLITESEFSYFPLLSLLNAAIAIFNRNGNEFIYISPNTL